MTLLEITQLNKSFGGIKAVNNCSFSIAKGKITALIGPNGAGKTTVFNLISGLLKPDSGTIKFKGVPIANLPPHKITRKGISRTFQITRDLQEMTVLENMVIQSRIHSIGDLFHDSIRGNDKSKAMELLDFVGISYLS